MKNRITPTWITSLKPNECFIFGSNRSGRHGKGAAKTALKWGAKWGQAEGLQGNTYGIPTVDAAIKNTLPLQEIKVYVDEFIKYAKHDKDTVFLLTEIGCGLAHLTPEEVAPLFKDAVDVENIHMPLSFWNVLNGKQ